MRRRSHVSLFAALLLAVFPSASAAQANGHLQLHYLDVGQGDAAAVISPLGETVLIDNGPSSSCSRSLAYLQALGFTRIDYHIASHYHADHIGCTPEVLARFPLALGAYDRGQSYTTQTYTRYVSAVGAKRHTAIPGNGIALDSDTDTPVFIDFVAANGNGVATTDENARSLVTVVRFGALNAVFGGDLTGTGPDVESSVAPLVGAAEVYKTHHHGSQTSSNTTWLSTVQPKVAIVSVGPDNSYGHPTQAALDRLHRANVTSYWTSAGNGAPPTPGADIVAGDVVVQMAPMASVFTVQHASGVDTYALATGNVWCGVATAQCNDGTWSCSTTASGTCSGHGGVACWVCPGVLCHGSEKPCTSVPPTCTYNATPTTHNVGAVATNGMVTVTATATCAWTAGSNVGWISITGGATGSGSGTVTFTVAANNTGVARSGTLTIAGQIVTVYQEAKARTTPTITWATPTSIVDGTALSATQLNATANVVGAFVYTPAAGTVLAMGTHTLSTTFTPADTVNYTSATASVSLEVLARVRGDFTGDGKSDVLWRHVTRGEVWVWLMNGATRVSETYVRTVADTNWEIRGLGDQTGDGKADILWRNKTTGMIYFWPMDGSAPLDEIFVGTVDTAYDIVGTGDFNGDGKSDILWRHLTNGEVWIWLMNGATPLAEVYVVTVDPVYVVKGSGDLNGDGKADIVWHHATQGDAWVWLMNGTAMVSETKVATVPDTGYQIVGVADHTGDGKADIVWHHATRGEVWMWPMDGTARLSETKVATVPDTGYRIVGNGDYNGDGKADLLWHHATRGEVWVWLMDGTTRLSETKVATVPDVGYQIVKVK